MHDWSWLRAFFRLVSRHPPELQSCESLSREKRSLPGGCPHRHRLLERDLSYVACMSVHGGDDSPGSLGGFPEAAAHLLGPGLSTPDHHLCKLLLVTRVGRDHTG